MSDQNLYGLTIIAYEYYEKKINSFDRAYIKLKKTDSEVVQYLKNKYGDAPEYPSGSTDVPKYVPAKKLGSWKLYIMALLPVLWFMRKKIKRMVK